MNNVTYFTLAAARNANPEAFDVQIRSAVFAAAHDVGQETVVRALSAPKTIEVSSRPKQAA